MIGVHVPAAGAEAAQEFFELLKVQWEVAAAGGEYDVVISSSPERPPARARVQLVFGGGATTWDATLGLASTRLPDGAVLEHGKTRLPLYGAAVAFPSSATK